MGGGSVEVWPCLPKMVDSRIFVSPRDAIFYLKQENIDKLERP